MSISTESVWQAFHEPLEQFIRRQARDTSATEDILQDVFVKIHTHIDSLKDESKLQAWLYRIARNAIYDYYRSQKPVAELSETLDLLEELPEEDMEQELLPCLADMVKRLPDNHRQALILTEYEGLSQKDLAQRLGLSLSGAKSRVQRARAQLKIMLLACCHFEFDRRGKIIDYQPRCTCCTTDATLPCQGQECCNG